MRPTQIKNGGPAFPHFQFTENGKIEICPQGGMTLRDYFAGQALAGFCAAPHDLRNKNDETMAKGAFEAADAMLAERKYSK